MGIELNQESHYIFLENEEILCLLQTYKKMMVFYEEIYLKLTTPKERSIQDKEIDSLTQLKKELNEYLERGLNTLEIDGNQLAHIKSLLQDWLSYQSTAIESNRNPTTELFLADSLLKRKALLARFCALS